MTNEDDRSPEKGELTTTMVGWLWRGYTPRTSLGYYCVRIYHMGSGLKNRNYYNDRVGVKFLGIHSTYRRSQLLWYTVKAIGIIDGEH